MMMSKIDKVIKRIKRIFLRFWCTLASQSLFVKKNGSPFTKENYFGFKNIETEFKKFFLVLK